MFTTFICACLHVWSSYLNHKALVTREFVETSEIMDSSATFVNACGGMNKLFPLFLTWLFVPQSSTSSAILNRKETTRMRVEHPGYTVSFAKVCGCAPPRTLPDLVKKLKARSAESYFWISRCSTAFCASLGSRELFCADFRIFQDEPAVCSMYQDCLSDGKAQLPWQGEVSCPMLGVGLV